MKIGITATRAAGAKTAAAYLSQKGQLQVSINDLIKQLLREEGIPATDSTVQEWKDQANSDPHPAFYYRKILSIIPGEDSIIIHDIEHPVLVDLLKQQFDIHLLAIDASAEIRFLRAKMTEIIDENSSIDQFRDQEQSHNQALHQCMAKADYTILNNKTIPDFTRELDSFVARI